MECMLIRSSGIVSRVGGNTSLCMACARVRECGKDQGVGTVDVARRKWEFVEITSIIYEG